MNPRHEISGQSDPAIYGHKCASGAITVAAMNWAEGDGLGGAFEGRLFKKSTSCPSFLSRPVYSGSDPTHLIQGPSRKRCQPPYSVNSRKSESIGQNTITWYLVHPSICFNRTKTEPKSNQREPNTEHICLVVRRTPSALLMTWSTIYLQTPKRAPWRASPLGGLVSWTARLAPSPPRRPQMALRLRTRVS